MPTNRYSGSGLGRAFHALTDRLRDARGAVRDRVTTRPDFVRFAARVPGLRSIARGRARDVFDLCAGFVYSQTLLACIETDLLSALAEAPCERTALEARLRMSPERAARLLGAARALGLVETRSGDRYGLGPLGAAVLANPGVIAMIHHHRMLYTDLADPVGLLRSDRIDTQMSTYWSYATSDTPGGLPAEDVADYSALMAASQSLVAAQVLDAYPIGRHAALLDVGGGLGAFVTAAAARAPDLRLAVFDLPGVLEGTRARLRAHALEDRVELAPGDFFADPLPEGFDVVSLVRIVHDHDDEPVRRLLARVRAAMAPGATLLVAEPMAETPSAPTVGEVYFAFYLLAMGSGRARSPRALTRMLEESGFGDVRLLPTDLPLQARVLIATAV
ncbi:MAG: methyltransferase [Myxococcota bacterium]